MIYVAKLFLLSIDNFKNYFKLIRKLKKTISKKLSSRKDLVKDDRESCFKKGVYLLENNLKLSLSNLDGSSFLEDLVKNVSIKEDFNIVEEVKILSKN